MNEICVRASDKKLPIDWIESFGGIHLLWMVVKVVAAYDPQVLGKSCNMLTDCPKPIQYWPLVTLFPFFSAPDSKIPQDTHTHSTVCVCLCFISSLDRWWRHTFTTRMENPWRHSYPTVILVNRTETTLNSWPLSANTKYWKWLLPLLRTDL